MGDTLRGTTVIEDKAGIQDPEASSKHRSTQLTLGRSPASGFQQCSKMLRVLSMNRSPSGLSGCSLSDTLSTTAYLPCIYNGFFPLEVHIQPFRARNNLRILSNNTLPQQIGNQMEGKEWRRTMEGLVDEVRELSERKLRKRLEHN